jgi:hypothetical protein
MQTSGEPHDDLEAHRLEACHSLQHLGHVFERDPARGKPRRMLSTWPEMAPRCVSSSCKMLSEEGLELAPRNEVYAIVQVDVTSARDNEQLLWLGR